LSARSFDIGTLLEFEPPRYLCERCCGLLRAAPFDWHTRKAVCPVCQVEYIPTDEYPYIRVGDYLEQEGLGVAFKDLIGHSRSLASIARQMRTAPASPQLPNGPSLLSGLFQCLLRAERFVHFVSYGMSEMLLGALRMAAQRVAVRGIVSNVEERLATELRDHAADARHLKTRLFERGADAAQWHAMPHQKVIIVDGLLAFKGSANLTVSGWRKAEAGRDIIEVVTDVQEVVALNNRFFSPVWTEFDSRQQIVMTADPFGDD